MTKEKKRKRNSEGRPTHVGGLDNTGSAVSPKNGSRNDDLDTSKPSAVFTPQGGRSWTLSVALPGSIVSNAKNHDSKTFLAGTIARALAVFCVDEIIIFDDGEEGAEAAIPPATAQTYTAFSHPSHFLAHLLSFLETPAHLRKALFGMHPNLRTAGTLPSLDMPHHLRSNEWCEYREGVTARTSTEGTYIDIGVSEHYLISDVDIPLSTRVTVRLSPPSSSSEVAAKPARTKTATAVDPAEPRQSLGYYWGYSVRRCDSLSAVLTESPFDGGYDLSIGTSERGKPLVETLSSLSLSSAIPKDDVMDSNSDSDIDIDNTTLSSLSPTKKEPPKFKHLLLVFGGVAGLETAATNDDELAKFGINKANVSELFDHWVNVLPGQGSRTIRTEEAVWLALMGIRAGGLIF